MEHMQELWFEINDMAIWLDISMVVLVKQSSYNLLILFTIGCLDIFRPHQRCGILLKISLCYSSPNFNISVKQNAIPIKHSWSSHPRPCSCCPRSIKHCAGWYASIYKLFDNISFARCQYGFRVESSRQNICFVRSH